MKKQSWHLVLFLSCCLFISCGNTDNFNSEKCLQMGLDANCFPQTDTEKLLKPVIKNINIFLDISGSMNGFMYSDTPTTKFQKTIYDIVEKLPQDYNQINYFTVTNSDNKFELQDLAKIKKIVNDGLSGWALDTYLPSIFGSILSKYQDSNSVNIFISDCIYSPNKKDKKQTDFAPTDITDAVLPFAKKSFATTILCLNSDFRRKKTGINIGNSPYYMVLFGKPENLRQVEGSLINSIKNTSSTFHQVRFGQSNSSRYYSVVPYSDALGSFEPETFDNSKSYRKIRVDGSSKNPISFWIGISTDDLPSFVQDTNYLADNMQLRFGGKLVSSRFSVKNKMNDVKEGEQNVVDKSNFFVETVLPDLPDDITILSLSLKYKRPIWIDSLNEPSDENNRRKTYGLNSIIKGLEDAYNVNDSSFLFKNLIISALKTR